MKYLRRGGVIQPNNWQESDNYRQMMEHIRTEREIHKDTYSDAIGERELLIEHFGEDAVDNVDEWIGGME